MEDTTVSLPGVRAVLAVLDEGSISSAAAALFVSQPALSRLVRVTEERVGLRLFDRRAGGVTPEAQAGPVFDRFRRVRRQLEQAALELAALPQMQGAEIPLVRHLALRHLRALVAVFDNGSATAAADHLGYSTTAVARAVRDVEALLGLVLFERQPGRLSPTRAGRLLATHAKRVLHELRYLHEDMNARSGAVTGHVAVGSMPLGRTLLVPEAIGRLAQRYPMLRFSVIEGPYDTLLSGLQCGDLDLVIGALREPAPAKNVCEEALFSEPLSVVVRSGHPLTERTSVRLEDLASATWVVPRRGTPARAFFEAMFLDLGFVPPQPVVECSSLIATRALLLRQDWIGLISRQQIHYEEQYGILTTLPLELPQTSRPIGLTMRADTAPPPATAAFAETLREVSAELTRPGDTPAFMPAQSPGRS